MAVSKQVTITTTSQAIVTVDDVTQNVYLHSKHNVFLGDEGVTTANGYNLENGSSLTITMYAGEVLWGVTDSGTGTLQVLITAQK